MMQLRILSPKHYCIKWRVKKWIGILHLQVWGGGLQQGEFFSIFRYNSMIYRVSKKMHLKDFFFVKPKNFTIGSGNHQNKKLPSFRPIDQKLHFYNGRFSPAIKNSKFPCKMSIFWSMGQKDGYFLFWSTLEPMVTF